MALDRDAPLPLQIHGVEQLIFHFPHLHRTRQFKDTIRQRRFTMVDVCNDAEITGMIQIRMSEEGNAQPSQADAKIQPYSIGIHHSAVYQPEIPTVLARISSNSKEE